jgi:hypothetical protein
MNIGMMLGNAVSNSITRTLNSAPCTPLETILDNPDFEASIRAGIPMLIDYMARPDNVSEALKWVLTPDYEAHPKFERLSRQAARVLSTAKSLNEKLCDNSVFIEGMVQCQKSFLGEHLRISGNFQAILLEYVRYTNGGFLQHVPNLCLFLVERLRVSSLQLLLIRLLTIYAEAFSDEELDEIVCQISTATQKPNGLYASATIRELLRERMTADQGLSSASPLLPKFQNEHIIRILLHAATSAPNIPHRPLFEAITFEIVHTIAKTCRRISASAISEYDQKYRFDLDTLHCGMISALRIFKSGLPILLPLFFQEPYNSMLNAVILSRIKELGEQELRQIIESMKIADHILIAFDEHLVNGQLTELADYLSTKQSLCPSLQTPAWLEFVKHELQPRLRLRISEEIQSDSPAESGGSALGSNRKGLKSTMSFGGLGTACKSMGSIMIAIAGQRLKPKKLSSEGAGLESLNLSPLVPPRGRTDQAHPDPLLYLADIIDVPMIC